MKKRLKLLSTAQEYAVLTIATLIMVVGIYVFKFPNNFSFGGVTGIAVILAKVTSIISDLRCGGGGLRGGGTACAGGQQQYSGKGCCQKSELCMFHIGFLRLVLSI